MASSTDKYGRQLLSVAPMMDWTDVHFRQLARIISKHTWLWTEMVVDKTILNNPNPEKFLWFPEEQRPLVLQMGGSEPETLAAAARIAALYGYDEINLNCGCPSDRVAGAGCFGATLMREPENVGDCMRAIGDASGTTVNVKCRLGVDQDDSYENLHRFVKVVSERSSVRHFIVHARKCFLKGLSPHQNRSIPPLRYEWLFGLKRDFPHLSFSLNGGIQSPYEALAYINRIPDASDLQHASAWAPESSENGASANGGAHADGGAHANGDACAGGVSGNGVGHQSSSSGLERGTPSSNGHAVGGNGVESKLGESEAVSLAERVASNGWASTTLHDSTVAQHSLSATQNGGALNGGASHAGSCADGSSGDGVCTERENNGSSAEQGSSEQAGGRGSGIENGIENGVGNGAGSGENGSDREHDAHTVRAYAVPTAPPGKAAVEGVMIGRAAYNDPWGVLGNADVAVFGAPSNPAASRRQVLQEYSKYADSVVGMWGTKPDGHREPNMRSLVKPLLNLFHGEKGSKRWKQEVDNLLKQDPPSVEYVLANSLHFLQDEPLDSPPRAEPNMEAALRGHFSATPAPKVVLGPLPKPSDRAGHQQDPNAPDTKRAASPVK